MLLLNSEDWGFSDLEGGNDRRLGGWRPLWRVDGGQVGAWLVCSSRYEVKGSLPGWEGEREEGGKEKERKGGRKRGRVRGSERERERKRIKAEREEKSRKGGEK